MVVDRCGRGHSLAAAVARTNATAEVHYVPGCDGLGHPRIQSAQNLDLKDSGALVEYARRQKIELVVVANVMALAQGMVDAFQEAEFPVVGPNRFSAQLEASKVFAKRLFKKYGLPTPDHESFTEKSAAVDFLRKNPEFRVVKADGLCGGNGAFVCDTLEDGLEAVERLMERRIFGDSGNQVVIERRIRGRELSFFAILDHGGWLTLPMALDYPKADDGNRGPISGGMGALSHHPAETPDLVSRIEERILRPLTELIRSEGLRYSGFIFLGIMVCNGEPMLLETNVRMGEPEAEVILPRIESDLTEIWQATTRGKVSSCGLKLNDERLCNVVATQGPVRETTELGEDVVVPGWPFGRLGIGQSVRGIERIDPSRCHLFVGEARQGPRGTLVSDGGRVLHVVGRGMSAQEARRNAYENIGLIWFEGMRYRHDIGAVMPWEEFD